MRVFVGALALGVALAGCNQTAQVNDRASFLTEATRVFPGETRERVIIAAETVLKQSDPADFDFQHSMRGFVGSRAYMVYAVIAAANGKERWEFETEEEAAGIRAVLQVSDAGTASGGYSTSQYEQRLASVPLYRLFWSRVEYVLHRRNDWASCAEATDALGPNPTIEALSGLCGITSDGRNAPPPPQLAALPVKRAPAPTGRRIRTSPRTAAQGM